MTYDRCVKVPDKPEIWLIKGRRRLHIKTWEDYEAMGRPEYEEITEEELLKYREVDSFLTRRRKRQDKTSE